MRACHTSYQDVVFSRRQSVARGSCLAQVSRPECQPPPLKLRESKPSCLPRTRPTQSVIERNLLLALCSRVFFATGARESAGFARPNSLVSVSPSDVPRSTQTSGTPVYLFGQVWRSTWPNTMPRVSAPKRRLVLGRVGIVSTGMSVLHRLCRAKNIGSEYPGCASYLPARPMTSPGCLGWVWSGSRPTLKLISDILARIFMMLISELPQPLC